MGLMQVAILESKFYRMTPEERVDALDKIREEAMEKETAPYTPKKPEMNTFPQWVQDIIRELKDEFKAGVKYDRTNNIYKIHVDDMDEDKFEAGWNVRVSKALEADPEKVKWHNESPLQLTSLVDMDEAAFDSDPDLKELKDLR
jgi:hypothetical protein